jgi:hypothetical protein
MISTGILKGLNEIVKTNQFISQIPEREFPSPLLDLNIE